MLALLSIPVLVLSSIWRGFVLTILWAWFIVPVFHLPVLGIVVAIGVSMVVSFLTYQTPPVNPGDVRTDIDKFSSAISAALATPAVYLLIGWIVHLFL